MIPYSYRKVVFRNSVATTDGFGIHKEGGFVPLFVFLDVGRGLLGAPSPLQKLVAWLLDIIRH